MTPAGPDESGARHPDGTPAHRPDSAPANRPDTAAANEPQPGDTGPPQAGAIRPPRPGSTRPPHPEDPRPRHLHDLLVRRAALSPSAPAVAAADGRCGYRELLRAAEAVAALLVRHGVRPGDRVLLHGSPSLALAAAVYGCSRAGAVLVPLHPGIRRPQLEHVVRDCAPALALVAPDHDELHRGSGVPAVPLAVPPSAPDGGGLPELPEPPEDPHRPAALLYTSGTTGAPKAVVSPHAAMLFAVTAIADRLGYRADDTVFCPLPFSFDYGLYQLFLATLAGASLVLPSPAETGPRLLRAVADSGTTVLPLMPAMASVLVRLAERAGGGPERVRLVTSTGAAFPEPLVDAVLRALPGAGVALMYGLTECKRVSVLTPGERASRPGSVGRPLAGTSCVVVDDEGREVPAGTEGQIVVRGPHLMAGYWGAPGASADRFPVRPDGTVELRTGDYGRVDADGYLYVTGRRDDLYKQNGFRVGGIEVERAALSVPGVVQAAVLPPAEGRPARLFLVTGLGPAEFLAGLGERLEQYKVPPSVRIVPELPLTAHGKVDRVRLAREAE
ncbi:AMP-binding protein [Streptomyces sp. NPDC007818]|uniref:class I adenylate-forming enzyme family protein n=1 Tax=Streptomyces sp. NPDC007818 TaxID=3364780 RepID=UPI0036C5BBA0